MSALVFQLGPTRLKIDASVVERLRAFAQRRPLDLEAGGILLGRQIENTSDTVVDALTEPMRGDRRGRTTFRRADPRHQRRIDEAWRSSRGTVGYLGEWHSHPESDPVPSSTDINDWKRRLRVDVVDAIETFFIIVGTSEIHAWRGDRVSGGIERMAAVPVPAAEPLRPTTHAGAATTTTSQEDR